jgi:hypothetical protein
MVEKLLGVERGIAHVVLSSVWRRPIVGTCHALKIGISHDLGGFSR